jgi:hypothetical protein
MPKEDGGFNSGFMPVPANQTDNCELLHFQNLEGVNDCFIVPTYTITVNDTNRQYIL